MTTYGFQIEALPEQQLQEIRDRGIDDAGNSLEPARRAEGGEPLRCCLRRADPGEEILLFQVRPFDTSGPYAETGPVFAHAAPCAGYRTGDCYPDSFRGIQLVFRCYGADGEIIGGRLVSGEHPEIVLNELFADGAVDFVHLRHVVYGCYVLKVRRALASAAN